MIPKVCANCDSGLLLTDDGNNPVPGICTWGPRWEHVFDCRNHFCGQFKMADEPRFEAGEGAGNDQEVHMD